MSYDPKADAMALDSNASSYDGSEEVMPSVIVAFDDEDHASGVEVLNVASIFSPEAIETLRAFTVSEADLRSMSSTPA